ncbi:probable beta-1,3-galactosyltransferase 4 [Helianthus annuus]|uniref:probable beta-1,3-galactosyltransferase 4 n=1 Tax=Helianthus annuus TaxID=4232 RepID=UPI0016531267|nr:probable beta-1,3-galactosyltransferase 4 [Helianthus annuus]
MWIEPEAKGIFKPTGIEAERLKLLADGCDTSVTGKRQGYNLISIYLCFIYKLLYYIEGYLELSAKTKTYFTTAVSLWDADFYVKVDDDVHVNIGILGATLSRYQSKPRVYVGCMKSGPVLDHKGVRYHEPGHWKFGEEGNKYFRHATGQLYAILKDLATYISINQ